MGLGINSMEGREAKHVALAKFARNSHHSSRWQHVFKHEFLSLIWLRENGYDSTQYKSTKDKYVPQRCFTAAFCNCGEPKEVSDTCCNFCTDPMQNVLRDCVAKGVITNAAKKIL